MLVECNIPIAKSECRTFQAFIERNTTSQCQVEKESKVNMNEVLFVLVDETTDRCDSPPWPLDGRFKDRPFLLDLLDIHAANNKIFNRPCLVKIWTTTVYTCSSLMEQVTELFPNMMHVACICHALNRVAELVRYELPLVDELISEIKKMLVKAPRRKKALAASGLAIVKAKKLFKDPKRPGQLAFIKSNFTQLVRTILSLQERLPLTESIEILEKVQMQLTVEPFANKLNIVLEKNLDFEKIKFYSRILKRETLELKDDPKLPFLFSCAPITTVDCERVFTKL
ncbi:Uncharacterized protein FKW44_021240 [Caligus rogercresseyi]|uniref:DUF659 domain-containing protein n=1 Tax=Caligus rogercresseyi TaxID=217165 RepID=A0A7T8GRH8_CALRO|nr:Uncharacterized protein FKW44_021240 [Caligus rogercresseyi]